MRSRCILLSVLFAFGIPAWAHEADSLASQAPRALAAPPPATIPLAQYRAMDLFSSMHPMLNQDQSPVPVPGKKSVGLAVLYSLAVPGMGELYAGGFRSGKYFLGAEALLWITYAAFDIRANSLQDDARTFATIHAGVDQAGKNDQFYVNIGNFLNTAEYNATKMQDRQPELVYDPAAGYHWAWDNDANRMVFRDQRIRADNVFNNRKFVIGAIMANHIASAINAARLVIAHNKEISDILGDLRFETSIQGGWANPQGVTLTIIRSF